MKKINSLEENLEKLTDSALKQKSIELRKSVQNSNNLDDFIEISFALTREAAKRTLKMRHFDVQLIGGIALHKGNIAEMKTGEGKTFVSTLSAYLNSLTGNGVHIISVNDYLTKRDFNWMKPVFEFLDISVGCVTDELSREEKMQEYNKDIVYVNNSTIGFDYLRDNIRNFGTKSMFKSAKFNYAIIDEADSILIDESRTPLIISAPSQQSAKMYTTIDKVVRLLKQECYIINEEEKIVHLTDIGVDAIEKELKNRGIIKSELYAVENYHIINNIQQAIKAHTLFKKNKEYLVQNRQIMLIDEFTGRILDGRRYSEGLHQAIEAKENVPIQEENQTIASITYQNLFRMYKKLSGMTGTAKTEEKEFEEIYHTRVIAIPTNKPVVRRDLNDLVYMNINDKNEAIIEKVKEINKTGQCILIGTASVEYSDNLSKLFKKNDIKHSVLNAKYHEKEAEIIANAGRKFAITISTNMAGRGTDIKLGGNFDIIFEEFCKNNPKASKKELDEAKDKIETQISLEKDEIISLGGLCIIGAERYESRRVDNQLRGRSGRQGDPGVTQFLLSLDDDLLRIFGGEKIKAIISRIGFKQKEPMEHKMLTNIIEYSQKRIESMNYDSRKYLIRYDDILNQQRFHIYDKREEILSKTANLQYIISEIIKELIEADDDSQEADYTQIEQTLGIKISNNSAHKDILDFCMQKVNKYKEKHEAQIIDDIFGNIILQTLDEIWKNHLSSMNSLRQSIHLRSYGQKDPLVEYQIESYKSYEQYIKQFGLLVLHRISSVQIDFNNKQ